MKQITYLEAHKLVGERVFVKTVSDKELIKSGYYRVAFHPLLGAYIFKGSKNESYSLKTCIAEKRIEVYQVKFNYSITFIHESPFDGELDIHNEIIRASNPYKAIVQAEKIIRDKPFVGRIIKHQAIQID